MPVERDPNYEMPMTESEFNLLVDELLTETETRIEDNAEDIDFDTVSDILTLSFENGSKIIINKQLAALQVWVAAKSGGFHLSYLNGQWVTDNDEGIEYFNLLEKLCSQQANRTVTLS